MAFNGFNPDASESKSTNKRHMDKFRRPVWLRRACFGFILLALAALIALVGFQPNGIPSEGSLESLRAAMVPEYWNRTEEIVGYVMHIENVIHMDTEILVLVRKSPNAGFPSKSEVECRYGNSTLFTYIKAKASNLFNHRAAVLCPAPSKEYPWDMNSISLAVGQDEEILPKVSVNRWPLPWLPRSKLAFEAFVTEYDVVVFVHGIHDTRARHRPPVPESQRLASYRCVYNEYHETKVTAQSLGVFRCALPPADLVPQLAGTKISIKYYGKFLPSVAYYYPWGEPSEAPALVGSVNRKLLETWTPPRYRVCSCTMIYNVAKFLKEWVHYNNHLGVEKFFLYDNNSDDDIDEVISSLNEAGFNVQKQAWPWVKTQEAGFSHCSLTAKSECEWMLFTDVDEYLFPNRHFVQNGKRPPKSPIIGRFISAQTSGRYKVGQISVFCYNFGPSGWTMSPPQGVTQGYTCRARKTERHKSIVLLSALDSNLENVIHHFTLRRGFSRKLIKPQTAAIYHYKFQAWDEFKTKFHRRASMHVADWTENRNHASNDRVRDLGTQAIKPADWESRYCDVHDHMLQDYIKRIFGYYDNEKTLHFPWE